jgi:hypothetical protein
VRPIIVFEFLIKINVPGTHPDPTSNAVVFALSDVTEALINVRRFSGYVGLPEDVRKL